MGEVTTRSKFCDVCKKSTTEKEFPEDKSWSTPFKWLRLTNIRVFYRKSDKKDGIGDKHTFIIGGDPDFCSKECFMEWIESNIDKIMK